MKISLNHDLKDSKVEWLGEIPNNWDVVPSWWLFSHRNEKAHESDRQLTASQKYGVIFQEDYVKLTGFNVVQVVKGAEILKHANKDDFVISMRSFQGGIERCHETGSVSSAYIVLEPSNEIDHGFFEYLFKSKEYVEALQSTTNLVRDGQALRYSNFKMIKLPLVPKSEQIKIATYLKSEVGKIDNLILVEKKLISLLKVKKRALISTIMSQGISPGKVVKNDKYYFFEDYNPNWKVCRIKDVCSMNDESLSTNYEGEIKYIDIGNVSLENGVESFEVFDSIKDAPSRARRIVRKGDVIVSTVRTYLKAISNITEKFDNYIVSTGFAVARPNSNINQEFLSYVAKSNYFVHQTQIRSNGVSYPSLTSENLKSIYILVPDLEEQKCIVKHLDCKMRKMDSLIEKSEQLLRVLKEKRSALISKAITGKIVLKDK